jgi:hypothetical protein
VGICVEERASLLDEGFGELTVNLIEVEDDVQLANIRKVRIQQLHEQVYTLQVTQFVILNVDGDGEEQSSVAAVDQFVIVILDEIRVFFVPGGHQAVHLRLDPGLLRLGLVTIGGVIRR